jgi:hypothetical protein
MNQAWRYRADAFRSFTSFVEEWLQYQDLATTDPVFRPQRDYLFGDSGRPLVSFVGRIERMHQVQNWVLTATGKEVQFDHLNRSTDVDYRIAYTSRTYDLVGNLYASDVETFGYVMGDE